MERRRQRRIKWRSSCELRANGRTVSATVLDLSEGGLSVRLVNEELEQQGTAKHSSASSLSSRLPKRLLSPRTSLPHAARFLHVGAEEPYGPDHQRCMAQIEQLPPP
jgi:hypothetical protein